MKTIAVFVGMLIAILGATWLFQGNDFFLYRYFGPKYEQTRREIFEQSRAFNQGMVQELQNMQFEYVKAPAAHKEALAAIIIHRATGYNLDDPIVPNDLRTFIVQLKRERADTR